MKDQDKTRDQLIEELVEMRQQIADLRESKQLYRKVFDSQLDAMFILDAAVPPVIIECNPMAVQMFGYECEEMLGRDAGFLHVSDLELLRFQEVVYPSITEYGFAYIADFHMKRKDGTVFTTEHNILELKDEQGERTGWVSVVHDTTQRSKTEENYRQLLDDMIDGYVVVKKGKYVFSNCRFAEMIGYDPEQVMGMSAFDVTMPEDRQALMDLYRKMERGEEAYLELNEVTAMKKDRTKLIAQATIKAIQYKGEPAFSVILRDITEHKQIVGKYRQLLEDMNDGYVVVQDGKYVFANKRFYEMFKYEPGEVIKKPIMQFIVQDVSQPVGKEFIKAVLGKKGSFERYEGIARRKDGRTFLCEATSKAIQYEGASAVCIIIRDITRRKRAEEALINSERQYRELAEGISDMFVAMDNKMRYTYWNKAAEIFTGILAKDALGKHPIEVLPDVKTIREAANVYLQVIRTKQPGQFIDKVRLGGKAYILEMNIYPSGNGISMFIRDITKRNRMEGELRESRERFQALVESTSDWVWEVDAKGVYTYASPRIRYLLGYEPGEVIGKTPFDFMPQEDAPELAERFRYIARSRKPFEGLENINIHKDGRLVVLETSGVPFFDAGGRLCGYRGIDRDITERKRAEDILRESEEKLRLTFESVPEGIIVCDLGGQIIDVNEGVVRMHGYDAKEDLIGQSCYRLMSEKDYIKAKGDFTKTLEKGSAGITLYTLIAKNGEEFLSATSTAVLRDSGGQPSGFVILTADVTEQQKRQEQLMLTDRLASIGQLTSGIAHELNNPLTSVIGFSDLLLEREFPEDVREDLETIDREARRAADIVKGLLTFVRKQRTEKVPVDINDIIREVLQLRSYEQRVSKIKVEAQFASDLPHVIGNGAQMQQVFVNLIVNAEQSMHEAHGKGRLRITTEKTGDIVRVSIDDDGLGISPEDMKSLFTPFFTTKEVGKGTGLGLSICHGIVTEHGGRIYAESKPVAGASFVVELPASSVRGELNEYSW